MSEGTSIEDRKKKNNNLTCTYMYLILKYLPPLFLLFGYISDSFKISHIAFDHFLVKIKTLMMLGMISLWIKQILQKANVLKLHVYCLSSHKMNTNFWSQ